MVITVNYNEKHGKTIPDESCDRYYNIVLGNATIHRKKVLTISLASSSAFKNLVIESAQCKTHKWVFLYKGRKLRVEKGFILNSPVKYLNMPKPEQNNRKLIGKKSILEQISAMGIGEIVANANPLVGFAPFDDIPPQPANIPQPVAQF